jgi:hypothetical protein
VQPAPEPSGERADGVPRRLDGIADRQQRCPGSFEEGLACRAEPQATHCTVEQHHAEGRFGLADPRAQYLLGNVQPPGAGGETALFGNGNEVPQMPEINLHACQA